MINVRKSYKARRHLRIRAGVIFPLQEARR